MPYRPLAILLLTSATACGGGGSQDIKVGGAWPTAPVKCSAYAGDRAAYEACLERDRRADSGGTGGSGATQVAVPPAT